MRTTVDIPDGLLERARPAMVRNALTLRAVVIDALERLLITPPSTFRLRDASAGYEVGDSTPRVSVEAVNQAIADLGEHSP